jgi:hypothetical protein
VKRLCGVERGLAEVSRDQSGDKLTVLKRAKMRRRRSLYKPVALAVAVAIWKSSS